MISIITGDVINSRQAGNNEWQDTLKAVLKQYGPDPATWEIYRGDSFQVEVPPAKAMYATILIKASIRQYKPLDVRMAIGIGEKEHTSSNITQSNGSAFVLSGECFEALKKKTLALRSPWLETDKEINLCLALASLTMNRWTEKASTVIKTAMENPNARQVELEKILNIGQGTISRHLTNSGYDEIMQMEKRYQELINRQ